MGARGNSANQIHHACLSSLNRIRVIRIFPTVNCKPETLWLHRHAVDSSAPRYSRSLASNTGADTKYAGD